MLNTFFLQCEKKRIHTNGNLSTHLNLKKPTNSGTVEKHSIIKRPTARRVKKKSIETSPRPTAGCYNKRFEL
jgi:hypothetical protein